MSHGNCLRKFKFTAVSQFRAHRCAYVDFSKNGSRQLLGVHIEDVVLSKYGRTLLFFFKRLREENVTAGNTSRKIENTFIKHIFA